MVGKFVLVRDDLAGVFFGKCEALDMATGTWTLSTARKIHYWASAGAVEGVVVHGPGVSSRVTATVTRIAGRTLVQVIECTSDEAAELMGQPEWKP